MRESSSGIPQGSYITSGDLIPIQLQGQRAWYFTFPQICNFLEITNSYSTQCESLPLLVRSIDLTKHLILTPVECGGSHALLHCGLLALFYWSLLALWCSSLLDLLCYGLLALLYCGMLALSCWSLPSVFMLHFAWLSLQLFACSFMLQRACSFMLRDACTFIQKFACFFLVSHDKVGQEHVLNQVHRGVRQPFVSACAKASRTTNRWSVPNAAPTYPRPAWTSQPSPSVALVCLSVSSNSRVGHLPVDKPWGDLSHRGSPHLDISRMSANLLSGSIAELAAVTQTDNLLRHGANNLIRHGPS